MISAPSACTANMVQDFTASPFIRTVQAPQYVVSHPTCVPVRSNSSRSSCTSNMRGSTVTECDLPFTFRWIATFSTVSGINGSGINMTDLNALAPRSLDGHCNGPLHQGRDQRPLVFCRPAHVWLGICRGTGGFHRRAQSFAVDSMPAQSGLGFSSPHRHQPHTAQEDRGVLADFSSHGQLDRRAGRRIHRGGTLEGQVGAAASFRRDFYHYLAHQFVMIESGGVSIGDETRERNRALASRT